MSDEDYPWDDIIPIAQNDSLEPIVAIQYSNEYKTKMDLFRGVMAIKEYSRRVLALTSTLLSMNAANYTIWQYRRECILAIQYPFSEELDFLDDFSDQNPKNYQIWHHRRAIVELYGDASRELDFCMNVFDIDAKNYHAWSHRQWVLKTFNLWGNELEYVEYLIERDVRNNSAWNQRWFVIHEGPIEINDDILRKEVDYCFKMLLLAKLNESPWNYIRGLLKYHPQLQNMIYPKVQEIAVDSQYSNQFALGIMAEIRQNENTEESLLQASAMYVKLSEIDLIRTKYWKKRSDDILFGTKF